MHPVPSHPTLPPNRRQWLARLTQLACLSASGSAALLPPAQASTDTEGRTGANVGLQAGPAQALPPRTLVFPRDYGSHPDLRTEWWYITGQATAAGRLWGFQVTFFRTRVDGAQGMRSAFAAKQLLMAHAALTDVYAGRLHHDQRIARAGFGVAQASEADTAIRLQDWSLTRTDLPDSSPDAPQDVPPGHPPGAALPRSRYAARVRGQDFALELQCDSTQALLLHGQQGLSRKGPQASQASYYYSQPQLAVRGHITLKGERMPITASTNGDENRAWMDHECSEALLHPEAVGWDWIGMNLLDGSALTAFRLRRADGSTLWAGGSFRAPGQSTQVFDAQAVAFTALRRWKSPRSGATYPTQWRVDTPAGAFTVQALIEDQELDSRASTGAIYWEGLCDLQKNAGARAGRGYLEMTGYAQPLRLT